MQKLIPLEEVRARLPVDPRTGLPPSRRWLRRQLLEHKCCIIMARQVYVTEALWDKFLCLRAATAPCAPTSNLTSAPVPARGGSAAGSRSGNQMVLSPEDESREVRKLAARRRLELKQNGGRRTTRDGRSQSASP